MRLRNKTILFLLVFVGFTASAQMADYNYAREIIGATEQWNKIELPDGVFGKISHRFSDIRIYGITAKNDTVEAPYILTTTENTKQVIARQFKAINTASNAAGSFFTFELNDEEIVNQIQLLINRQNFDWKIQLEGSQDQKEWFTLLDDYRILSIANEQTNYQFTTLVFSDAKYRFYRVFIPSLDNISLHSELQFVKAITDVQKLNTFKIASQKTTENKAEKQTEIELTLRQAVPVNQLQMHVVANFDYYRPLSIYYVRDSVKTENGYFFNYEFLYSGTLNSVDQNLFLFSSTIVKKLKIIVQNQDNQPLNIDRIAVKGSPQQLTFRLTQAANYFLVYGNEFAADPSYDIAQHRKNIPNEAAILKLGDEILIPKTPKETVKPLFENTLWLWGIMLFVIALLGWLSIKMLRKS